MKVIKCALCVSKVEVTSPRMERFTGSVITSVISYQWLAQWTPGAPPDYSVSVVSGANHVFIYFSFTHFVVFFDSLSLWEFEKSASRKWGRCGSVPEDRVAAGANAQGLGGAIS